jgi:hypothetical protein
MMDMTYESMMAFAESWIAGTGNIDSQIRLFGFYYWLFLPIGGPCNSIRH